MIQQGRIVRRAINLSSIVFLVLNFFLFDYIKNQLKFMIMTRSREMGVGGGGGEGKKCLPKQFCLLNHFMYGRRVVGLVPALYLLDDSYRTRQETECIPHPAVYFSYFNFDFCVVGASESDGVESIFLRP